MNNENLKPCKPGETHNPNGRPKGARSFKTVLKEMLAGIDNGKDWGNPIAEQLVKIAFGKDSSDADKLKAMAQMLDRQEGKPQQSVETSNAVTVKFDSELEKDI